jgi:hypothetical protein
MPCCRPNCSSARLAERRLLLAETFHLGLDTRAKLVRRHVRLADRGDVVRSDAACSAAQPGHVTRREGECDDAEEAEGDDHAEPRLGEAAEETEHEWPIDRD